MLPFISTEVPLMTNGSRSALTILPATTAAPTSWVLGRRTANSSPPSRATVSESRKTFWSRRATSRSRSSPAAWPWESLISLKRSAGADREAEGAMDPLTCGDEGAHDAGLRDQITHPDGFVLHPNAPGQIGAGAEGPALGQALDGVRG